MATRPPSRPAQGRTPTPAAEGTIPAQRGPQRKPGAVQPPGDPVKPRRANTLGEGKATPFVFPEALEGVKLTRQGLYRVMATETGYIHHQRKREGDVFDVTAEEYSDRWMEPVEPRTRLKTTGPQEAINREHDRILEDRRPQSDSPIE